MNTYRQQHKLPLEELARWLCEGPADFMGWSKKGRIAVGCDADLVAWNPEGRFVVDAQQLHHRHPITPYDGQQLLGIVEHTWLGGQLVYDHASFPAGACGRSLLRGKRDVSFE